MMPLIEDQGQTTRVTMNAADCSLANFYANLNFNVPRAMVMTRTRAKNQAQRSAGSMDTYTVSQKTRHQTLAHNFPKC